jgi:hypothetical protein
MTTIEVRFHRTVVAWMDVRRLASYRYDLHAKLVTENSWIAKERLISIEGVDISTADADPANSNQGFVGLKRGSGLNRGKQRQPAGLFETDRFHR